MSYSAIPDGFCAVLAELAQTAPLGLLENSTDLMVQRALEAPMLSPRDFMALLSPAGARRLEPLARRSRADTLRQFGRAIQFFTPLYLANFCTNRCVYCGFSAKKHIERRKLTLDEVEAEARSIAATGLRRILALTGDAPAQTGAAYLAECLAVLAKYFPSVGIEVPSMTVAEYRLLGEAGADSMTMFQETYNEPRYLELHPAGPKRDFAFRLDAPERALLGGLRGVNLGPLLGLDNWRRDVFFTGLHAQMLSRKYPEAEISVSLPRMRPCTDDAAFQPQEVTDADLVQALAALRCFLPQLGITLSTREPAWLRDKLIPLGVTRVSAGVCTAVGGHAASRSEDTPQFEISDGRSVEEMAAALEAMGYQPVYTDWLLTLDGAKELSQGIGSALGGLREGTRPYAW